MSRASTAALDELHATLASTLAKRIASGEATAADLNVARAFLKDNGIEAVAVAGSGLAGLRTALTDSLPFAGDGSGLRVVKS